MLRVQGLKDLIKESAKQEESVRTAELHTQQQLLPRGAARLVVLAAPLPRRCCIAL